MKKFTTIISLLIFTSIGVCQAEGIEFFQGSWEEAIAEANKQDKMIFVDAYTTWCGPCKRMAANIFPLKDVGDFYNANFINMKLDMEKGEGLTVRAKYGVTAFPTFLFVAGSGDLQHKHVGGLPAERFIAMGETALSKMDFSKDYAAKYEEGDRSPQLLREYAYSLKKSNKPALKIANEYLRTQEDLKSETNLRFILAMTLEADSRIFDLLMENKSAISGLEGEQKVKDQVEIACYNTVAKAIEYQTDFLLDDAKNKMKENYPEKADEFALASDVEYFLKSVKSDEFLKAAEKYLKKTDKDKASEMKRLAEEASGLFEDVPQVMQSAEKWAKKASSLREEFDFLFTYASILYLNGKNSEAMVVAKKAMELATKEKKDPRPVHMLIQELENRV